MLTFSLLFFLISSANSCLQIKSQAGCSSCNIVGLIKDVGDPRFSNNFRPLLEPDSNGCFQWFGGCARNDESMTCASTELMAKNASGEYPIRNGWTAQDAFGTITCGSNGKFHHGDVTNIEEISCVFEGCSIPSNCNSCNMNDITLLEGDQYTVTVEEKPSVDGCGQIYAKCTVKGTQLCGSMTLLGRNPDGYQSIRDGFSLVDSWSFLTCGSSGKYSSRFMSDIDGLSCSVDRCWPDPSCDQCIPYGVSMYPKSPNEGVAYHGMPPLEGCMRTGFLCVRKDGMTCQSIGLKARNSTGEYFIENETVLTCGYTGKLNYGDITNIDEIYCATEDCAPSKCDTCDMTGLYKQPEDPNSHIYHEALTPENGCSRTQVICQRTDDKICESYNLKARNSTGEYFIEDESTSTSASTSLNCDLSGKFYHGSVTQIDELSCYFENCI